MNKAQEFALAYQERSSQGGTHVEMVRDTLKKFTEHIDMEECTHDIVAFNDKSWAQWNGRGWTITEPAKTKS